MVSLKSGIATSLLLLAAVIVGVGGDCTELKQCSGHGLCDDKTSTCSCFEGYGSIEDITTYRAPDCSARTCPAGKAWADVAVSNAFAHQLAECSNRGICNRASGDCLCYTGFTGSACQRSKCPNGCSGHGQCVSIMEMAKLSNALPLAPNTFYEGDDEGKTWDEDKSYGCVCDSSWTVGLGSNETQEPEWHGPDCSLRHCPSGDDPRTIMDETNCFNKTAKDSIYRGGEGNKCHVDCSNRGRCNLQTGICQCFNGYFGENCSTIEDRAKYAFWNTYDGRI